MSWGPAPPHTPPSSSASEPEDEPPHRSWMSAMTGALEEEVEFRRDSLDRMMHPVGNSPTSPTHSRRSGSASPTLADDALLTRRDGQFLTVSLVEQLADELERELVTELRGGEHRAARALLEEEETDAEVHRQLREQALTLELAACLLETVEGEADNPKAVLAVSF